MPAAGATQATAPIANRYLQANKYIIELNLIKKLLIQVKKDDKKNLLFFLVPFSLFFIYKIYIHSSVKIGNYTIGYIETVYWPVISHKKFSYFYFVNGVKYNGSDIYDSTSPMNVDERFIVQFSTKHLNESDLLKKRKIPDSIIHAPKNGWKNIPAWSIK